MWPWNIRYPNVNNEIINLDFVFDEFKKVHKELADTILYVDNGKLYIDGKLADATHQAELAELSKQAAAASATAAAASETSASNSATAASNSATAAAGSATQAAQTVANTQSQVALLQSRVDNIIPSGTQTEGNTELLDIRVGVDGTIYDSAGNSVRGQIRNVLKALQNCVNVGFDDAALSATLTQYINYTTGVSGVANAHYSCTPRLKIPEGCTRINFPGIGVLTAGNGGWAVYSANTGTEAHDYIRGGQSTYIDVQSGEYYFAITDYSANTASTSIEVEYVFGEINSKIEYLNSIQEGNYTENISMYNGRYWNSTTGQSGSNANYSATPNRIKIPDGCVGIVFPSVKYNFAGTGGWAVYSANTGTETHDYIRGGQSTYIEVQSGDKYYTFTTFGGSVSSVEVVYLIGNLGKELFDTKYPIAKKLLCFVGDSVTYGYDDSNSGAQLQNPFPKQVCELLKAFSSNEGVNSASLMEGTMPGGSPTPKAWCVDYTDLYDGYDIIGTLIGINDAYRNYTLGTFSDTTTDTFYGALHTYWKGMLNKYKPENGKRLFCMLYPQYDSSYAAERYENFRTALIEVANYYSIPILDLAHEMGVSCYADSNYTYWAHTTEGHSPHLTQIGANVISPVIANFIKTHF